MMFVGKLSFLVKRKFSHTNIIHIFRIFLIEGEIIYMRNDFYSKISIAALVLGLVTGVFSGVFYGEEYSDVYGAWLPCFYNCENPELWAKVFFSGPIFTIAVFVIGFFILGYLFVYPIGFYYAYTFGYLFASTVICFGASELIHVILKLPSFAATLWLICKLTSEAVKFSITAFSGLEYYELRVKVSHYLLKGLKCVALSALPLVYDAIFVPKILNLWDSF